MKTTTIAQDFDEWWEKCGPENPHPIQTQEMRRAFFSGYVAGVTAPNNISHLNSKALHNQLAEAEAFFEANTQHN